jgi:hypothetical protein
LPLLRHHRRANVLQRTWISHFGAGEENEATTAVIDAAMLMRKMPLHFDTATFGEHTLLNHVMRDPHKLTRSRFDGGFSMVVLVFDPDAAST